MADMTEAEAHSGHVFNDGFVVSRMSAQLYPNLESFHGQLFTIPPDLSPEQKTDIAREDAIKSAAHAVRINESLRGGLEKNVDMVVGARLQVRPRPDWDLLPGFAPAERTQFENQCRAWFNNWAFDTALNQDAEGHYDFGGLMWLAYSTLVGPQAETAGAILRDPDRAAKKGANWETFVNVIHPARVRTPPMMAGREKELGIYKGRQLDEWGAWEGLYVTKKHPSDPATSLSDYAFVPRVADDGTPMAWHWFEKIEPGAQRGMTKLITSLRHSTMMDKFDDAQLGAAILESLFSFSVKSNAAAETVKERLAPAAGSGVSLADYRLGFYDKIKLRFGEKRVPILPEGDELVFSALNRASQDPTKFLNHFLRRFASVTGTTFEQLANNWSDANYSAARAALLDLWRGILRRRHLFALIPSLCYVAVISEAIDRGRIVLPAGAPPFNSEFRAAYTRCAWMGPGMGQIDPEKEAKADEINLRLKTTTREEIYANRGMYYYDGFQQTATEIEEADELGFTLDMPMPGQNPAAADSGGDPVGEGDGTGGGDGGNGDQGSGGQS